MRLLLAEDEKDLARGLSVLLERNNYSVDVVYNGNDAVDYGMNGDYDGLILDVMMPGKDGFEVLRELRANGIQTPALFLTAKSENDDIVNGLDLGADDYLTKPFVMDVLLARIRAMTRRKEDAAAPILSFGNTTLNRATFELRAPKGSIRLANKEYQMMEILLEHPGNVVPTEHFLEHIWGYDTDVELNSVWTYISFLRKKLKSIGSDLEIKANRGVGYSLGKKND